MGHRVAIFVLLIAASVGVSMGNGNWWHYGWGKPKLPKVTENKIIVGGSSNWTFGFNYARWASKQGVFHVNDTLVFKYNPPSPSSPHPHNVYLIPDFLSYQKCNLTNAVKLANETQGAGDGFHYKLAKWQPYFFACGVGNGFHCSNGTMKFIVMPRYRCGI
ncbi:Cupredoxin superfamily protein [Euphorbia peplus]|nr:Cupredoxin superfamily protein [Euphorbia peplus]